MSDMAKMKAKDKHAEDEYTPNKYWTGKERKEEDDSCCTRMCCCCTGGIIFCCLAVIGLIVGLVVGLSFSLDYYHTKFDYGFTENVNMDDFGARKDYINS